VNKIKELTAQAKLLLQKARARSGAVDVAMRTFKKFSEDDGGPYSAALTYYTFFSIFPMLFFAASILGYLTLGNEELRNDILKAGLNSVPMLKDVLSPGGLTFIEERRQGFAITGAVMALYSGTGAVVALQHALNRFQGITDEPNWVQKRLKSLKFVAIFGAAVIVSITLGAIAGFATNLFAPETTIGGKVVEVVDVRGLTSDNQRAVIEIDGQSFTGAPGDTVGAGYTIGSIENECVTVSLGEETTTTGGSRCKSLTPAGIIAWITGHVIGFLVGVLIFVGAYKFLPALRRNWRDVLPGALIAAFFFEVLKEVGTFYMERGSQGREATFGVFALSAGLLVACYLISQITLMAAEVNDVLMERKLTRQTHLIDTKEA
jgi:uncharacterized BrkB/YihY/UPF0761 family membrane protein